MKIPVLQLIPLAMLVVVSACSAKELDRRCLAGDCVILMIESGKVLVERTGEFAVKREVAKYDQRGAPLVPSNEAPILYAETPRGWIAIVTAFLPREFDFDAPELRVYILDSQRQQRTVADAYNLLESFHVGRIFNTNSEFVQISTTGSHAYVVRTLVWLLPESGPPTSLMDVPGLLDRIEVPAGQPSGLWINREMYDGVRSDTKGQKPEFWKWDADRKMLILTQRR